MASAGIIEEDAIELFRLFGICVIYSDGLESLICLLSADVRKQTFAMTFDSWNGIPSEDKNAFGAKCGGIHASCRPPLQSLV